MLVTLGTLLGVVYAVCVLGLFLYGMNAYLLVALHRAGRRRSNPAVPPLTEWPAVTVQLPVYNERYVARRLLESIGALDYPADRLEIQVLDDSTDETTLSSRRKRVKNLKANFPQGVYQLEVDTAGAAVNPRDWHFVAADHQCNTTDILSFPHEPRPPRVIPP